MTIYLIRHAQSEFNAAYEEGGDDPMIFDAPLSRLGEVQAMQLRKIVRGLDIAHVMVSPLTRTLQTADIVFGNAFPVRVVADIREQVSNSCDVGRSPPELALQFPHLDFAHLAGRWWHDEEKDHRGVSVEPEHVLQKRADDFIEFARKTRMRSTAIVSHGNFIRAVSGVKPDNCGIVPLDLSLV